MSETQKLNLNTTQKRRNAEVSAPSAFVAGASIYTRPVSTLALSVVLIATVLFGSSQKVSACDFYCGLTGSLGISAGIGGYIGAGLGAGISAGVDFAPSYGFSGGVGIGYPTNTYNYVQYPNSYYQYAQNPAPRNSMADYYANASSLQYPYMTYQYNQNPAPRDPMADYYAAASSVQYPYLRYQYAQNPAPRNSLDDYYTNAASASYPYSIYVPVGSNQASVLSKYNTVSSYAQSGGYQPGYSTGSYNYGNTQGSGFVMTSGY